MNRDQLIASGQALLDLDARGALVPHGIGGHAREIIEGFIALSSLPAQSVGVKRDEPDAFEAWWNGDGARWKHREISDYSLRKVLAWEGWWAAAKSLYDAQSHADRLAPSQPAAVGVTDEMVEARRIVAEMLARDERNDFLPAWWRERLAVLEAALRGTP